jgi:hypothetical protein
MVFSHNGFLLDTYTCFSTLSVLKFNFSVLFIENARITISPMMIGARKSHQHVN